MLVKMTQSKFPEFIEEPWKLYKSTSLNHKFIKKGYGITDINIKSSGLYSLELADGYHQFILVTNNNGWLTSNVQSLRDTMTVTQFDIVALFETRNDFYEEVLTSFAPRILSMLNEHDVLSSAITYSYDTNMIDRPISIPLHSALLIAQLITEAKDITQDERRLLMIDSVLQSLLGNIKAIIDIDNHVDKI